MEVKVSLRLRLPFPPKNIPGTQFSKRLSQSKSNSGAGRIRKIRKPNDLIGTETSDFLACITVPQATATYTEQDAREKQGRTLPIQRM
jgi:hypothetical protein